MFLARHRNYPGKKTPRDPTKGMEISGNIQPSESLTKRRTLPTSNMKRLKTNLVARNRDIFRHLQRGTNPTLQDKCWEMSVEEYEKGWMSKPTPATQRDRTFTALSPRFPIDEKRGNQKPKYRAIGDLTKSHVNLTVGASDTYCPRDLDTFMVLARLQHKYGASNLRMWPLGFSNAYKTIGTNEASKDVSHICLLSPTNKRLRNARVLVQPFGSRRAPASWGRVVTFLQFLEGGNSTRAHWRVRRWRFLRRITSPSNGRFLGLQTARRIGRLPHFKEEGSTAFNRNGSPWIGCVVT